MRTLIEHSKITYCSTSENPTDIEIQTGCLQRIATASELTAEAAVLMAKNFLKLQADAALYKLWYEEEQVITKKLQRSNAALRGHLKRLKNTNDDAVI